MARDGLVTAPNCTKCKLYEIKCEGVDVSKGANLHFCPSYIKGTSNTIIQDDVEAPYPIIKKVRKRGRKT